MTTLAEYLTGFETRAEVRGVARGIIRSGRKYGATDAQIKADLVEQLNMSTGDAERAMHELGA